MKHSIFYIVLLWGMGALAQQGNETQPYKKRVLETTEVDFLSSYYGQEGDNAAVTGGLGTEALTDVTGTFVVSIPLNDDAVLAIDAGVSAYTSASSSNVNPFDGGQLADPFVASSGASSSDLWSSIKGVYTHSSDDRNDIWSAQFSVAAEYDYFSIGFGGGYSKLFNEKNTEVSVNTTIFLDQWNAIYPIELRPFAANGIGSFRASEITGNTNYAPDFNTFDQTNRNSYALGLGFSQILHKNVQASLAVDVVQQQGLLSTPFQRVYFADVDNAFVEGFQLADDIERLPDSRFKVALGGRLNWYLNETFTLRTFYRYYLDDWGIRSNTASAELPIKITQKFTLYPSYRYYDQQAADYFAPFDAHRSTDVFYTSDFDLSRYKAHQFGMGVNYTDIFTGARLWKFGLKSIDLKMYQYDRDTTFTSFIITGGVKFVMD